MASESTNHHTSKANTNGVLPVTAAQTSGKPPVKAVNPKLKVIIRRLAPGLTEAEFAQYLGEEWTVGCGKVNWFSYRPGKESKDPSKPSYPSRAYLHLTHNDHLMTLVEAVRSATFEDARNTWNSSCLIGPPSVEFAPFGRVPTGRLRNDSKSGTIDQDSDFMDFLESLANPLPAKEPVSEPTTEEGSASSETVSTTPLIQYLKDKKANKGKENTATVKTGKPVTVKAISKPPVKEPSPTAEDSKKKGKDAKIERLVGKATKEAIKVLNREAASREVIACAPSASSTPAAAAPESATKTPRSITRERGSVAAVAKLIQRDLGLSSSNAHRKAKADIAAVEAKAAVGQTTGETSASQAAQSSVSTPTGPRSTETRTRGRGSRGGAAENKASGSSKDTGKNNVITAPAAAAGPSITLLKKPVAATPAPSVSTSAPARTPTPAARTPTPAARTPTPAARTSNPASRAPSTARAPGPAQTKPQTTPAAPNPSTSAPSASRQRNPPPQPTPSAGATRAFIKHANPSQGVTEALLKEALEAYGATTSVEIDKRKGFAYVDFVTPDGLAKAMKANPIKIANGTVQVLERNDRTSQSGGNRAARAGPSNAETSNAADAGASASGGGGGSRRSGGRNGGGVGGGGGGRNRGRHGRGGGGGPATAPQAGQSSSSSAQPASAPPAAKEAAK